MNHSQQIQFATITENNIVQKVGRSTIYQPRTVNIYREMKWYEDKLKKGYKRPAENKDF